MSNRNFIPFPELKTKRLFLRQLKSSDENQIFILRSDINVNKYLDRKGCKSIEDARYFIEYILKNQSLYWAITLDNNTVIGTICLFDFSEDNTKAEIGYELLPGFQRQGIMQEAMFKVIEFGFHHLGLSLIEAYTHPGNLSSTNILDKFSFQKEKNVSNSLHKFKLEPKSFNAEL